MRPQNYTLSSGGWGGVQIGPVQLSTHALEMHWGGIPFSSDKLVLKLYYFNDFYRRSGL